jgi:hypothetical protein
LPAAAGGRISSSWDGYCGANVYSAYRKQRFVGLGLVFAAPTVICQTFNCPAAYAPFTPVNAIRALIENVGLVDKHRKSFPLRSRHQIGS